MRAVIWILFICISLTGCKSCEGVRPPANTKPPSTHNPPLDLPAVEKPKTDDPLEQAKYEMLKYKEAAAQAEARYETMKRQAYDDSVRSQVMWITGIALLIAALAGVAAFLVPIGKKTCIALAVGCVTVAACAQAFREAVPYLPWIGGALLIGGGIWAAINWRKLSQTVRTAADHGDRLEEWLREDVFPNLDDKGRELLEKTIKGVKDESQKQAQRLGVHAPLQYLRGKSPSLWKRIIDA